MSESATPRTPAPLVARHRSVTSHRLDRASAIADDADRTDSTLREAALRSGFVSADDFDRIVDPRRRVGLTDVTV